ncbi:putative cyclin-F2-1 [Triticum aestivum]|uniref:putative cyclin-F2-1 n=1 Tax=Triticum aestivum TaxID=4565 RepID=UPI001D00E0DE|nr:putative cyclin-F2-1 [Triticum aestivum]
MAVMDPFTADLLSGPSLPGAFSCAADHRMEFDDAYLRAIGALPPLPTVHLAPPHLHHAALKDSVELPATLYAATVDAHLFPPPFEVPLPSLLPDRVVPDSKNTAARPHLSGFEFAPTPADHAAALECSVELPATCQLYAAALDAHLFHPSLEVPAPSLLPDRVVPDCKNSATRPRLSDYDIDIDFNLREMEKNVEERPSPDYLNTVQGDRMSPSMRATLVFWMDDFTRHYDLAPGTLHRAVSYVDRVLSARTLSTARTDMEYELCLLGATAVFTAAKYEERGTRFKVNAAKIADDCGFATSKEVTDMECKMFAALRYELSGPTAYTFVDHFTRYNNGERELEVQRLAHQLAETSLVDYRCLQLMPSAVAASAVFLARLILNPMASQVQKWNREFTKLTGYKPTDLILGIQSLYMMNPDPRFVILPEFL